MDNSQLQRTARVKLVLSIVAIGVIFFAQLVAVVVVIALDIGSDSLWEGIIPELGGALAAIAMFTVIGGRPWMRVSGGPIVFALRYGWWCIAVNLLFLVPALIEFSMKGTALSPEWPQRLFETALLCLLIGVFEEFLFRGIIFNGLLAVRGGTHQGLMRVVVLTSLLFGLAHVVIPTDFNTPLAAAQGALKVTQTGLYSILLCTIALRTKNIVGVTVLHAIDDFLLIAPSTVLYQESATADYVLEGSEGLYTIALYLVVCLLYLPFVIPSLRDLRRGQDVYRGVFMREFEVPVGWPTVVAPTVVAPEPEAPASPQPSSGRPPAPPGF